MVDAGTSTENFALVSLRAEMTASLLAHLASADSSQSKAKQSLVKDSRQEKRREAILFALDNFHTLCDSSSGNITQERLYDILRYGKISSAFTPLASFLYREIATIGHANGTKESTTYYAAGSSAMPVTFKRTTYAIDALDLFTALWIMSKSAA